MNLLSREHTSRERFVKGYARGDNGMDGRSPTEMIADPRLRGDDKRDRGDDKEGRGDDKFV